MTDRYAVIGNPIAHSKSPEIHTRFAQDSGQNLSYDRQLAPLDGFEKTVRELIASGAKGANVTVPFKLEAHKLADNLTERAQAAGAVNTLKFENNTITGDNTDGIGLVTDIVTNAATPLQNARILLLGAGGASRGVILPILEQQPRQLVIANRTAEKAAQLAKQFSRHGPIEASTFEALQSQFDVIINATSASLGSELPPVPPQVFGTGTLAYDMMYGPQPTVFMRFAAEHGASVRDGLGMLVEQAAEAFLVWRGMRPETSALLAELRAAL